MHTRLFSLLALACLIACEQTSPPVTLHPANQPPAKLSDWGILIAKTDFIELNDRVVPYSLNMPLFSDYALKLRTIWLPEGSSAGFVDDGPMDFPVGTIISKTFHYEKAEGFDDTAFRVVKADREAALDSNGRLSLEKFVLVETRLLVRYDDGWKGLPYVWNSMQDEAFLEIAGDARKITHVSSAGDEEFVYFVPDTNQCAGCHVTDSASKQMRPLGPTAWQLNRKHQLEQWEQSGLLSNLSAEPATGVRWLEPGDATLDQRARAYLDVNCAHCHNEAGAADTSALDLDLKTSNERDLGICKPPVAVGRGSGDRPYDIYPGRPNESILLYRMQQTEPDIAMPELGRSTIHQEAVTLLTEWIKSMDGTC